MIKGLPSLSTSPTRILVVDDSSLVQRYYLDVLQKSGFQVEQALNGLEAMEKVLAQAFDLAILDVNMPKLDGFSFLRELRCAAAEAATLPVLVVTTQSGRRDIGEARIAGVNFYLVKPVSEADLLRHALVLTGIRQ